MNKLELLNENYKYYSETYKPWYEDFQELGNECGITLIDDEVGSIIFLINRGQAPDHIDRIEAELNKATLRCLNKNSEHYSTFLFNLNILSYILQLAKDVVGKNINTD